MAHVKYDSDGSRSHPECQLGAGSQREKIQDHSRNLTPKYKADTVLCVDWWLADFFSQTDPVHMPQCKHLFKEWHSSQSW